MIAVAYTRNIKVSWEASNDLSCLKRLRQTSQISKWRDKDFKCQVSQMDLKGA